MTQKARAGRLATRMRGWLRIRRPFALNDLAASLRMSLYRGHPEDRRTISDLDVGSFLRQFLESSHDLNAAGTPGTVRLSVEWQRSWELAVTAELVGTEAFLRGVPDVLGRRLTDWLVGQAHVLGGTTAPTVLFGDGAVRTIGRIDLSSTQHAANTLELGIVNALSSERLHLIVEPAE